MARTVKKAGMKTEATTSTAGTNDRADAVARNLLKRPYARVLIPQEEGGYSAEILEFPGCFAEGETAEDTYRDLEEAARVWIAECVVKGEPIPQPLTSAEGSGKFALRLPRALYVRASKAAARDHISLNQFIVNAVAERLGAAVAIGRVEDVVAQLRNLARHFYFNARIASTPGTTGATVAAEDFSIPSNLH